MGRGYKNVENWILILEKLDDYCKEQRGCDFKYADILFIDPKEVSKILYKCVGSLQDQKNKKE